MGGWGETLEVTHLKGYFQWGYHVQCKCSAPYVNVETRFVKLDVRGSVHHSTNHKKIQKDATMYQNFINPYLYEAQHVSGDTPPIIRSLKLHWKPLVLHTWRVVGRVVVGCCQAQCQLCLTTSNNYMSNNLPRMQNQRLPVQF